VHSVSSQHGSAPIVQTWGPSGPKSSQYAVFPGVFYFVFIILKCEAFYKLYKILQEVACQLVSAPDDPGCSI